MTTRPSVPPIRRSRENPLFSDTSTPEPAAAPVKNRQVMVYMQPGMLADLDKMRAEVAARTGRSLDRSALVRAALRIAAEDDDRWTAEAQED